jgi:signal transduction histidine kinase
MKLAVEKKVTLGFTFALIMLGVIGMTSYTSVMQLRDDSRSVKRAQEIITRLESIFSTISDAAYSARSYVITGDEDYLEPYYSALQNVNLNTRYLHELIADPSQQQRLVILEQLVSERLLVSSEVIELRREQGFAAAQLQILIDKGKDLHDRIRHLIDEMINEEQVLLEESDQRASRSAGITIAVIIVGGLLSFSIVGLSLFFIQRDISERKHTGIALQEANAALVRQAEELTSARERAESADRLKSAFLATMSHELRTPLNSIIGFTGVILQELPGPLNAEQKKQLGMVQSSARHLLALINDVLDISKIEADQLKFYLEPFDLRTSINNVTDSVRPLAGAKGLTLDVKVMPAVGEVISDKRRVEQILLNLLSNAVKFTEKGNITLHADITENYTGGAGSPAVCLTVTDTGTGIKAEDMDKLFKPFSQIDTGLSRTYEGTGLGLAICKKIVEKLGGSINMTSEWGKGSEFTLTLPVNGST